MCVSRANVRKQSENGSVRLDRDNNLPTSRGSGPPYYHSRHKMGQGVIPTALDCDRGLPFMTSRAGYAGWVGLGLGG